MNKKKPEILHSEIVANSRLFQVEGLQLRFSNGAERYYERMAGPGRDAVMIVPVTKDNAMILIREYAAGTGDYELGFPKGAIDPGETPLQAANRELMEEIGFGARRWIELKTVTMSPAYFAGRMHLYLALELYPEQLTGDEPEPLQQVTVPLADSGRLLAGDEFNEARSITALLLAQRWFDCNSVR